MQQIRNLDQTKSAPIMEHFCILKSILVRERGLEPPRVLSSLVPETSASTNSATRA